VIVRGRDCRGSNDRHRKSSGRFERFITAHKTNKPTNQQNKQTTKHKKQTTMRFTLSALLIVSASATSMLPDARCGALTQCYLVNLATSGRNNVFNPVGTPVGATVTAYDPTAAGNDGYSIYCDTEGKVNYVKYVYGGDRPNTHYSPPWWANGDGDDEFGRRVNTWQLLAHCGLKEIQVVSYTWDGTDDFPCNSLTIKLDAKCDEPPVPAPVPVPTEAPITAPTEAPVVAPTEAPVAAPTEAPVAAPTEAPVAAPTKAPVQPPTKAPVRPCHPITCPANSIPNAENDGCVDSLYECICVTGFTKTDGKCVSPPTKAPVRPPTHAPVKPPTKAPVHSPTYALVKPPTKAPVRPPTYTLVKPPTKAPVRPPTHAPVKPPTKAPVVPPKVEICTNDCIVMEGAVEYKVIGNSMSNSEDRRDCSKKSSSSATLTVPTGAHIEKVYLQWSGSGLVDSAVKLNGSTVHAAKTFSQHLYNMDFFGAYADVTDLVLGSGTYTVSELSWSNEYRVCQANAAYGAWSLVAVYSGGDAIAGTRVHVCQDKFRMTFPSGTYTSSIGCIDNAYQCNSNAKITLVTYEGDAYKGEYFYVGNKYFGDNKFRGTTAPNLDINTFDLGNDIVTGTKNLEYTFKTYYVDSAFGGAVEGLFDFVKVLKYRSDCV
jgi:hypothetical protein